LLTFGPISRLFWRSFFIAARHSIRLSGAICAGAL
jgi:hypothetical protein